MPINNNMITIVLARMDPSVCREENGASIKTMNDNLQQVELFALKIGNENCSRRPKVRWGCEVGSIFNNVCIVRRQRPRQPPSHSRLDTLS
ncbi:hypothetical protein ACE6H2_002442 [Prunus campanulata]